MKKRTIKIGILLFFVTLATIGTKMADNDKISSFGLMLSNMEALASDSEGGGKGKECSFGRSYTGVESDIAYECIDPGRTICIKWVKCRQSSSKNGYCTNY